MVKLQDYTATEKDEVSLDCELSKDVPVVWYHEEKEIVASKMMVMRSEGTRRSLVLKKVEQSNKGKYVCDCGTDKTSANISIEGMKPLCYINLQSVSETDMELILLPLFYNNFIFLFFCCFTSSS